MDNCSGSLQAASNGQFAAFLFLQVLSGHYRWTIFISTLFPFFKIAQNYRLECVCFFHSHFNLQANQFGLHSSIVLQAAAANYESSLKLVIMMS